MEDTLISFETAKLAKLKGFDWECDNVYKQPIYTQRGTSIKEKREYRVFHNGYEYTSITELTFSKKEYSAPTQSLLQKWLREKHTIHVLVWNNHVDVIEGSFFPIMNYDLIIALENPTNFKTYEEALETGLLAVLKFIKEKYEK